MTRVLRLSCACVALVLGAHGCHHDDPSSRAIRSTLTSAVAPPSVRTSRWKLVQRIYRDRDYQPLWTAGPKLNSAT